MTNLTRDVLVKCIVAEEMKTREDESFKDTSTYTQQLKTLYHKWEHVSSDELCDRYNKIFNLDISTDQLIP